MYILVFVRVLKRLGSFSKLSKFMKKHSMKYKVNTIRFYKYLPLAHTMHPFAV